MYRRFEILGVIAAVCLLSGTPAIAGDEKDTARKQSPLAAFGLDGAVAMKDSELGGVSGDAEATSDRKGTTLSGQGPQSGLAGQIATPEVSGSVNLRDVPGVMTMQPYPHLERLF